MTELPAIIATVEIRKDYLVLVIRPVKGNWQAPPAKRLALLLKSMLRAFGWECVDVKGKLE